MATVETRQAAAAVEPGSEPHICPLSLSCFQCLCVCVSLQAKALAVNESNLQGELDGAVLALQERAALLDALNAKLTSVADTLDAFEHELQARS